MYDSYTVSYNANGGSNAPASQTKIEGTTLTLSSQIPGRLGYTFLGWSTSSTATSPTYYVGGSYTANSGATLYAVWSRDVYTISYNANGGTGAPTSQSKYYDQAISITTATPARDSYKFLGWAETASATIPTYYAGDTYDANKSTTLYAVWQEVNYDFSVSNLTAAPSEVSQYDTVSVAFRIDSWDRYNPYTNIPVAVLMNGKTVYSTTVNIAAYGVKNISFNLNVGASEGTQRLEARVNWADHNNETRTGNNTVSTTFEVIKVIETSVDAATTNGEYVEGQEVITSFYVRNDNNRDILPTDNLTFDFKVYTVGNGGNEVAVVNQTKTGIVIPANGTNLVYFKWKVPEGSAGTPYWCRGSITPSRGEANTSNNATEFAIVSAPKYVSQTENTRYEDKAPASYNASVSAPTDKAGSATWNEWTYENGAFVLKTYGITVSSDNPVITPSSGCTTAEKYGTSWKMKSGYGIALSWNPTIRSYSGYSMPTSDAYTGVQTAYATFPEFSYNVAYGKYRTLEYAGGKYQFEVNTDADKNERVHFIPVYVKDGSYTVSVTAGGIWTPAGLVTATRSANTVVINGTIYSDWYQG